MHASRRRKNGELFKYMSTCQINNPYYLPREQESGRVVCERIAAKARYYPQDDWIIQGQWNDISCIS